MNHIDPHHLTCRDAAELVTDYLEGALSSRDLHAFEEHVVLCDGCSAHLSNLRRIRRVTRRVSPRGVEIGDKPAARLVDNALLQKLTSALRLSPMGA